MDLAGDVGVPHFEALIHTFIQDQLHMPLTEPLDFDPNVNIYTSAMAIYHAPSDICGIHGMAKEHIHATPKWGKFKVPCYDTAFAVTDPNIPGMGGLDISRVQLIFSFKHGGRTYPCALVHWFSKIDDEPDVNTGMWQVQPDFDADGDPLYAVIHLDTTICTAHLIGQTDGPLPAAITHVTILDMFLLCQQIYRPSCI